MRTNVQVGLAGLLAGIYLIPATNLYKKTMSKRHFLKPVEGLSKSLNTSRPIRFVKPVGRKLGNFGSRLKETGTRVKMINSKIVSHVEKGEADLRKAFILFSILVLAFFMLDISVTSVVLGQTITAVINLIPVL